MILTFAGLLAIPIGMGLLWFAPSALLPLSVFFIAFSGTAVLNIQKSADSASGVPMWMYFGTLHLVWELVCLPNRRLQKRADMVWTRLPIAAMAAFLGAVVASLLMPLWIDGQLWIRSQYLMDSSSSPLHFGLKHITAALYIVYGLLFTLALATKCSDPFVFRRYLRLYCWSALFVCAWGWLQLLLYYLHRSYPAFIFNSSVSPGAEMYASEYTDWGLKRISSVSVEPSILAQYILTVLPFILFRVIARRPLISGFWDKLICGALLVTLVLSTSTTAYVGLLLLLPLLAFYAHRLRLLRRFDVVVAGLATCTIVALIIVSQTAKELFTSDVAGKFSTYSGLERAHSVTTAVEYFYQYPLLGVGWGSVASHDLIVTLLANAGIVGLISFVLLLGVCFVRLRKAVRSGVNGRDHDRILDLLACFVALTVLIAVNVVTGFAYVFGHFWFVLALSLGIPLQPYSKQCRCRPALK